MISSSENNVNNLWESDGSMKGIYQGNEFDVECPPCKKKRCRNSQKFFGTNRGPNGNTQTTLLYDCTWFDTHCMDILGSDDQICFHLVLKVQHIMYR